MAEPVRFRSRWDAYLYDSKIDLDEAVQKVDELLKGFYGIDMKALMEEKKMMITEKLTGDSGE